MMKPLAIDLFTGLHGWSEGLIAEGFRVVGFDLEDMCGQFGIPRPDGVQLVIQDVLTLHGSQFKDAALIVASPPCQNYSYMAMPWSRAKAMQADIEADPEKRVKLTALFDACFRIQREAIAAAGHFIPLVVENVRGANRWVGRSRWNYGSFHLWGDLPALMPMTKCIAKMPGRDYAKVPGFRFDGSGKSFQTASVEGMKSVQDGLGGYGGSFGWNNTPMRRGNSKSSGRKAASAQIAKIPLPLARHIARAWLPQ